MQTSKPFNTRERIAKLIYTPGLLSGNMPLLDTPKKWDCASFCRESYQSEVLTQKLTA